MQSHKESQQSGTVPHTETALGKGFTNATHETRQASRCSGGHRKRRWQWGMAVGAPELLKRRALP